MRNNAGTLNSQLSRVFGEFNRSSQHHSDVRRCNMSLKQGRIDKHARFWVLMAGGSTLTAACEAVGVNRMSGCRWRQATDGRIPRKQPVSSGRYLSLEERLQIADLYLGGAGVRAIAVGIDRSPATVSRELRRNGSAPTPPRLGKYAPYPSAQSRTASNASPVAWNEDGRWHLAPATAGSRSAAQAG